ncbi:hypothetical protein [Streptomyces sp. TLI_171]|uniref:hypothetical protein n=1 Tax=Streptomyces sp. TLI_171 TaxID=1938859 RepID=UPI000C1949EB|nr:hypothetical protein [Streptomyces sp. TLI_171]
MGLTPIAGQNDDSEFFSQSNARTLETFAASKGVQELSFWEVNGYDKPLNYAYSKIFQKITTGSIANDFSVTLSPTSGSVKAGSSATIAVSTAVASGSAQSVALSVSGLPAGAGASFSPAAVNAGSGSTLTVTTGSSGACNAAWNSTTACVPHDQVSYAGHNYTALYWSTGVTPGTPIAWNIWQDNGTC